MPPVSEWMSLPASWEWVVMLPSVSQFWSHLSIWCLLQIHSKTARFPFPFVILVHIIWSSSENIWWKFTEDSVSAWKPTCASPCCALWWMLGVEVGGGWMNIFRVFNMDSILWSNLEMKKPNVWIDSVHFLEYLNVIFKFVDSKNLYYHISFKVRRYVILRGRDNRLF